MKYGIIIFVLLFSAITAALAQSSGEIYHINESGIRSDTIDFDIVFYQNSTPVLRKVILNNTGKTRLQIATKQSPDFAIIRINTNTFEHREFDADQSTVFPLVIEPGAIDSITITYTSNIDISPSQYPLGERMATLILALTPVGDPSNIIVSDTFHLAVLKTRDVLSTKQNLLDFDSVYVGDEIHVEKDWNVKNISDKNVSVTSQNFTPFLTLFKEGFVPQIPGPFTFLKLTNRPIWIQFKPKEMGLDSARYSVVYFPNIDNQTDSVSVQLRGVGVQQIIEIEQATAVPCCANVASADLISISNSVRIGDSVVVTIVIQNKGNIPFGLISQHLEGSSSSNFYILKKFKEDQDLGPKSTENKGELDTAIVVFTPTDLGNFSIDYVLESNIRSRIHTAPDSSSQHIIKIVVSAAKPNLVVLNAANSVIDFDSVFLSFDPSCASPRVPFKLTMRNTGNVPLKISSAIIRPTGVFTTSSPIAEIPSNQESSIYVTFSPTDSGLFTADFLIVSNSGGSSNDVRDTTRIRLTGKAYQPPEVSVSLPRTTRSKAGKPISIPILVSKSIKNVKRMETSFTYQDTLGLEYVGYISLGTASEGDTIVSNRNGNKITLIITAPDRSLYEKDTLILLLFNTYLSTFETSSLELTAKAGDPNCHAAFPVPSDQRLRAIFALDSLCGTTYRQVLNAGAGYQLRSFASNPTDQIAFIEYSLPYTSKTTVKMFTTFGAEVSTVAEGIFEPGTYRAAVSVSDLPPGVYYCVMQSGLFHTMQTIVVTR